MEIFLLRHTQFLEVFVCQSPTIHSYFGLMAQLILFVMQGNTMQVEEEFPLHCV